MAKTTEEAPVNFGELPLHELNKRLGGDDIPLPHVAAARKQRSDHLRERLEREREFRELGGTPPPEKPIPAEIASAVTLPELTSVRNLLAETDRLAHEREALMQEDADASERHRRERSVRVEAQAKAIAAGKPLPNAEQEIAAEQRYVASREARRVRLEYLASAAEKVREQGEARLAEDIRRLQTTVRTQSAARAPQVEDLLRGLLKLYEDEEALERAALAQVGNVKKALARYNSALPSVLWKARKSCARGKTASRR